MTVGIYGIFDKRDNTCLYVGQSKHVEYRLKKHIVSLRSERHARSGFNLWFKENGEENLETRILEECENTPFTKNQLEVKWFNELSPIFFGKMPATSGSWGSGIKIPGNIKASELLKMNLTKDEVEKIYADCNFSIIELSKLWKCSANAVYNLFKHLGIAPSRNRKWIPTQIKCGFCNENFTPKDKRTRTCSYSCRSKLGRTISEPKEEISSTLSIPGLTLNGSREQRAAKVAAHNRWHKSRGIISDSCEICKVESPVTSEIA